MTPRTDRLLIDYTLAFNTPFHCGTGIRESLIDRTVVRDSDGYLYVPGSTLKGVLRDRCEQIARFYGQTEPAMNNGTPADTGMQRVPSPHDATAALAGLGKSKPTMITRIFGSQNKPGLLFLTMPIKVRKSESNTIARKSLWSRARAKASIRACR